MASDEEGTERKGSATSVWRALSKSASSRSQITGKFASSRSQITGKSASSRSQITGKSASPGSQITSMSAYSRSQITGKSAYSRSQITGKSASPGSQITGKSASSRGQITGKSASPGSQITGKSASSRSQITGKSASPGSQITGKSASPGSQITGKSASPGSQITSMCAYSRSQITGKSASSRGQITGKSASPGSQITGKSASPGSQITGKSASPGSQITGKSASPGSQITSMSAYSRSQITGKSASSRGQITGKSASPGSQITGKSASPGSQITGKSASPGSQITGKSASPGSQITGKSASPGSQITGKSASPGSQITSMCAYSRSQITGKSASSRGQITGKSASPGSQITGKSASPGSQITGKSASPGSQITGKSASPGSQITSMCAYSRSQITGKSAYSRSQITGKSASSRGQITGKSASPGSQITGKSASPGSQITGKTASLNFDGDYRPIPIHPPEFPGSIRYTQYGAPTIFSPLFPQSRSESSRKMASDEEGTEREALATSVRRALSQSASSRSQITTWPPSSGTQLTGKSASLNFDGGCTPSSIHPPEFQGIIPYPLYANPTVFSPPFPQSRSAVLQTGGIRATDASEQPDCEKETPGYVAWKMLEETKAQNPKEEERDVYCAAPPYKVTGFHPLSCHVTIGSATKPSLSTGSWKDELSPTTPSGHSLKRKAAHSASAARIKRTAVRLQSPSTSGPAGSLLSEQPEHEEGGEDDEVLKTGAESTEERGRSLSIGPEKDELSQIVGKSASSGMQITGKSTFLNLDSDFTPISIHLPNALGFSPYPLNGNQTIFSSPFPQRRSRSSRKMPSDEEGTKREASASVRRVVSKSASSRSQIIDKSASLNLDGDYKPSSIHPAEFPGNIRYPQYEAPTVFSPPFPQSRSAVLQDSTEGIKATDASEQPDCEKETPVYGACKVLEETKAQNPKEEEKDVYSAVPPYKVTGVQPLIHHVTLFIGPRKDELSPTPPSGHSRKRKAAHSASAARTKMTAVRLQSPSPSGPAGSLLSEQPDCEAAGDVVPMEAEPAVPAVSCPPAPPSSPPGPGRAGRGSGRLPRSRSLPSLAHIPCAESRSFTRANSSPDVLLASSWEEFTPAVSAEAFRFQCSRPGLYQCRETGLLFHMEAGGDVVYRTVPWSRRLLARHHKQPAGPLFDITCEQRCVRQLHLPHCEIRSTGGWRFLSVAHEHDDGVEFIAPHKVTATHVVINVTGFSAFGNVKDDDCPPAPVRALVLLFYRPPADPDPEALLNVLLLPRNVVLRDVVRTRRKLVGEEVYIETSPHCKLQPKQEYTLSAGPGDDSVLVQPAEAEFDSDNYDNYFPSFQVSWETVLKHVRLLLRDSGGSRSVWERRVGLPAAGGRRSLGPSALNGPPDERLMGVRSGFIQGVSGPVLKSLLDKLFEKTVLAEPERESADERPNLRDKARFVIDTVRKKGAAASSQMIEFLCDVDPFLCEHLGLL